LIAEKYITLLIEGLKALEISHSRVIVEKMVSFLNELITWNSRINLIGTNDPAEIIIKHIIDSLAVMKFIVDTKEPVVDLGPGGGFPSITLSIVCADKNFIGVERRLKRASFLEYVVLRLGLKNYRVFRGDIREFKEKVPIVLSRGVGDSLEVFLNTKHILEPGGRLILYKGRKSKVDQEIKVLKDRIGDGEKLEISLENVEVPFLDEERNLLIIKRLIKK